VEAVLDDVRDGVVTLEQAEREYGCVVDPDTFEVEHLTPERRQHPAGPVRR
jgi:N-methylhydantoinase B